jgi:hypothetical protein
MVSAGRREAKGRRVRDEWCRAVDELLLAAKPAWRKSWDELDPADPAEAFQREMDMRIGAAIAAPYEDLLALVWGPARRHGILLLLGLTAEQEELWADALEASRERRG